MANQNDGITLDTSTLSNLEKSQLPRIDTGKTRISWEDLRASRFYDCLQKCDHLTIGYAETAEAKEAAGISTEITGDLSHPRPSCPEQADLFTLGEAQ